MTVAQPKAASHSGNTGRHVVQCKTPFRGLAIRTKPYLLLSVDGGVQDEWDVQHFRFQELGCSCLNL
ncbi:hypothetical protein SK128_005883, partial [Halocaridina rubra]